MTAPGAIPAAGFGPHADFPQQLIGDTKNYAGVLDVVARACIEAGVGVDQLGRLRHVLGVPAVPLGAGDVLDRGEHVTVIRVAEEHPRLAVLAEVDGADTEGTQP